MATPVIRPIEPRDDQAVAAVIRTVMPELGADDPGFAIRDAEVDFLSRAYTRPSPAYFVVEVGGRVLGGGGLAPLDGRGRAPGRGPGGVSATRRRARASPGAAALRWA